MLNSTTKGSENEEPRQFQTGKLPRVSCKTKDAKDCLQAFMGHPQHVWRHLGRLANQFSFCIPFVGGFYLHIRAAQHLSATPCFPCSGSRTPCVSEAFSGALPSAYLEFLISSAVRPFGARPRQPACRAHCTTWKRSTQRPAFGRFASVQIFIHLAPLHVTRHLLAIAFVRPYHALPVMVHDHHDVLVSLLVAGFSSMPMRLRSVQSLMGWVSRRSHTRPAISRQQGTFTVCTPHFGHMTRYVSISMYAFRSPRSSVHHFLRSRPLS